MRCRGGELQVTWRQGVVSAPRWGGEDGDAYNVNRMYVILIVQSLYQLFLDIIFTSYLFSNYISNIIVLHEYMTHMICMISHVAYYVTL